MSDHFSGPRALADPVIDITDLYAFPHPDRAGWLVLVMNVFPFAAASALFSDAAEYRFRVRPVRITATGAAAAFAVGEPEHVFRCTFAAPHGLDGGDGLVQDGICRGPTGEAVSFRVNHEPGGQSNGLRVFAGARLDSFFIDLLPVQAAFSDGRLAFATDGTNSVAGLNVLSIVVEADIASLLGTDDGPMVAVVAETVTRGAIEARFERIGRPEVKNFVLQPQARDQVNRDLEIRDLYNQEDAFKVGQPYLGAYRARLNANLAFYDGIDGKTDWQPDERGNHPLTELLLADFLAVDVSKPYHEASFFEIERAMLQGRSHDTCGGRSLNDDITDTLLSVFINAGNGPRISDGVHQATVRGSLAFPYLAPPNPTPPQGVFKAAGSES